MLVLIYWLRGLSFASAPGIAAGLLFTVAAMELLRASLYLLIGVIVVQVIISWSTPRSARAGVRRLTVRSTPCSGASSRRSERRPLALFVLVVAQILLILLDNVARLVPEEVRPRTRPARRPACTARGRQLVADEGRVLALALEQVGRDLHVRVRVEYAQVAPAHGEVPAGTPRIAAGRKLLRQAPAEARCASPSPTSGKRQQQLEARRPGSDSAKGICFASRPPGVVRAQRVDGALGEPCAERVAVAKATEGRTTWQCESK